MVVIMMVMKEAWSMKIIEALAGWGKEEEARWGLLMKGDRQAPGWDMGWRIGDRGRDKAGRDTAVEGGGNDHGRKGIGR